MPELVPIRRALLSVSDKKDLVPFARGLSELGVQIISTGGTATALRAAGVEVISVETVTGSPEMMDGRVKTLHPAIHGGVLARRDQPSHVEAMQRHQIEPIDLVCINLYPFEQTIKLDGVTEAEAVEQIDIGGPALLRSSAKNHDFVTVVTSADQYDRVITEIRANDGATTDQLRREFAAAAFARTAEYDTTISAWMGARHSAGFPEMLRLSFARAHDLRYGENPHQRAAIYVDPSTRDLGVLAARSRHGKPLSYNNLLDADAALELVRDLHELFPDVAAAGVIKHTSPCGAAVASDLGDAFVRAYEGDPLAAFGGVLGLSRPVTPELARIIADGKRFLELVVAPDLDPEACTVLSERWPNVRLLATGPFAGRTGGELGYRSIAGGLLVQELDRHKPANPRTWQHVAGPSPDDAVLADVSFAWTVVKHVKSNAIAIATDGRLLGSGPGQVDRVGACGVAIAKAAPHLKAMGDHTRCIVAASDAFFPFPDGPQLLIDAGVRCIVQPGGSKRDAETIDLCEQHNVTCMLTGVRHFRH